MTFVEVLDSARRCRFPTGVDASGADQWCGADTGSPRASWCPAHRALVFLPEERAPNRLRLATLAGGEIRREPEPGADPQPGWRNVEKSSDEERTG